MLLACVMTPGQSTLPSGTFTLLEQVIFVLVARIGAFEAVGAGIDLQHIFDDVGQARPRRAAGPR